MPPLTPEGDWPQYLNLQHEPEPASSANEVVDLPARRVSAAAAAAAAEEERVERGASAAEWAAAAAVVSTVGALAPSAAAAAAAVRESMCASGLAAPTVGAHAPTESGAVLAGMKDKDRKKAAADGFCEVCRVRYSSFTEVRIPYLPALLTITHDRSRVAHEISVAQEDSDSTRGLETL